MNQPPFLIVSSIPSLKSIAQISSHSFLAESTYFHRFPTLHKKYMSVKTHVLETWTFLMPFWGPTENLGPTENFCPIGIVRRGNETEVTIRWTNVAVHHTGNHP